VIDAGARLDVAEFAEGPSMSTLAAVALILAASVLAERVLDQITGRLYQPRSGTPVRLRTRRGELAP
jgi:hypothetical protein